MQRRANESAVAICPRVLVARPCASRSTDWRYNLLERNRPPFEVSTSHVVVIASNCAYQRRRRSLPAAGTEQVNRYVTCQLQRSVAKHDVPMRSSSQPEQTLSQSIACLFIIGIRP